MYKNILLYFNSFFFVRVFTIWWHQSGPVNKSNRDFLIALWYPCVIIYCTTSHAIFFLPKLQVISHINTILYVSGNICNIYFHLFFVILKKLKDTCVSVQRMGFSCGVQNSVDAVVGNAWINISLMLFISNANLAL